MQILIGIILIAAATSITVYIVKPALIKNFYKIRHWSKSE